MSRCMTLGRFLALSVSGMALAGAVAAQTTGDIRGEVRDANGDGLPGVTVAATIEDRGVSRTTITGVGGRFVISSLQVDDYVVTAVLDGFQEHRVEGVRVGISATVNLDIQLALETVEEEVTVTASPILDVTSSSVGTSFTADFIDDLPTDRNFWDMVAVSPGISPSSEGSTSMSAFGSSTASNSWRIDGLDTTSSDTGHAFWWTNPAIIEEVQVLGIGAPAEYGSMSGAAINIVTKSGTNDFSGTFDWYHQNDGLTEENADIDGVPFNRQEFDDLTATLGGPFVQDNVWFFGSVQVTDDAYSEPGVDPTFPTAYPTERYDIKVNASFNDSNAMEAKFHYEDYDWIFAAPNTTPDATGSEFGTNPAWGLQFQSALTPNDFLEVMYAGYSSEDFLLSATGSTADPYTDYSPPEGGPAQSLGGYLWPYRWILGRDQLDVKLSHHADDLLGGDHDFKFGISYGTGTGDTRTGAGPNGVYFFRYEYYPGYPYYYRVTSRPYHYGADTRAISAFADDSWQVTSNLTLNVGVRYDNHNGEIPDFAKLNQDWSASSEIIPGIKDVVDWTLVSPRLGMAYQIGDRQVLRAFYGKFYDADVTGNWYAPPPNPAVYYYDFGPSLDGPWTQYSTFEYRENLHNPDLRAPETDQFTLGWERRLWQHFTLGIQGVYKEAANLIGWEILDDGVTENVPWTNPFSGETVQLISILEQPTTRKGNGPGPGSAAPPGIGYNQEYEGVVLSMNKRYSDGWSFQSSYTWSKSTGFIPRPLTQSQGNPFYTASDGRDPNNWINADQALQNDREHVLQFQGSFELPWKLIGTTTYTYMSGKPYSRQLLVGARSSASPLAQGSQRLIAIPASDDTRLPDQNNFDVSLGRRFDVGKVQLKLDVQMFNIFNEDTYDWWQSLQVPPDEEYVPSGYLFPRRVMIRFGLEF